MFSLATVRWSVNRLVHLHFLQNFYNSNRSEQQKEKKTFSTSAATNWLSCFREENLHFKQRCQSWFFAHDNIFTVNRKLLTMRKGHETLFRSVNGTKACMQLLSRFRGLSVVCLSLFVSSLSHYTLARIKSIVSQIVKLKHVSSLDID